MNVKIVVVVVVVVNIFIMNYIDATVTSVGKIYQRAEEWANGFWFLDAMYVAANCTPVPYTFMSKDRTELENITPGYKFLV